MAAATSKKPNYIGVLIVGAVAVGGYFLYQKFFNKSGSDSGALDLGGSGGGAGGDLGGGSEDPLSQIQDQMQPTAVNSYAGDPNPTYRQQVPQTVADLFAAAPSYSSLGQAILPKTYAGQTIVYNTAPNSKTGEVATFQGGSTFGNSMLQGQQVGYVQVDSSKPLPSYSLVSSSSSSGGSGGSSKSSSSSVPAGVKAGTTFQSVTVKSSTGQTLNMSVSSGFAAKLSAALKSTSSSSSSSSSKAKKK